MRHVLPAVADATKDLAWIHMDARYQPPLQWDLSVLTAMGAAVLHALRLTCSQYNKRGEDHSRLNSILRQFCLLWPLTSHAKDRNAMACHVIFCQQHSTEQHGMA